MVLVGKIVDPHPYLSIWLLCRRLQGEGTRPLPEAGGVLDQTWELTWAFGVLDSAYAEETEIRNNLTQNATHLEQLRQQLLHKA